MKILIYFVCLNLNFLISFYTSKLTLNYGRQKKRRGLSAGTSGNQLGRNYQRNTRRKQQADFGIQGRHGLCLGEVSLAGDEKILWPGGPEKSQADDCQQNLIPYKNNSIY